MLSVVKLNVVEPLGIPKAIWGQCYKNTMVIYQITAVKTLLFLGLKYRGNLLSYCSYLPLFQGKFNVINIHMVIYCHSTVITN
jgi:hypothetical protein